MVSEWVSYTSEGKNKWKTQFRVRKMGQEKEKTKIRKRQNDKGILVILHFFIHFQTSIHEKDNFSTF